MKKDIVLVREIMTEVERLGMGEYPFSISVEGFSAQEVNYHLSLLNDAGFIIPAQVGVHTKLVTSVYRLTDSGHEFLMALKDETVWTKLKPALGDLGKQAFETVKAVAIALAIAEAKKKLGI